jgi:hypothetical protein
MSSGGVFDDKFYEIANKMFDRESKYIQKKGKKAYLNKLKKYQSNIKESSRYLYLQKTGKIGRKNVKKEGYTKVNLPKATPDELEFLSKDGYINVNLPKATPEEIDFLSKELQQEPELAQVFRNEISKFHPIEAPSIPEGTPPSVPEIQELIIDLRQNPTEAKKFKKEINQLNNSIQQEGDQETDLLYKKIDEMFEIMQEISSILYDREDKGKTDYLQLPLRNFIENVSTFRDTFEIV